MKKKIIPILLAIIILLVLLTLVNPGLREKINVVLSYLSSWLGIDWGSIKGWRSAELMFCYSCLGKHL
ncbi:MAG: hypothetical protein LJE89_16305 [Deltaproteobacteria bacterium]|nr:hypothetical protein [Deltaproteobacteria bacterium]